MAEKELQASNGAEASLALPGPIVDPDWLEEHLTHRSLRLLDVRPRDAYNDGHLPGAVWTDLAALTCVHDNVPGMLLPAGQFADQMGKLGVSQNYTVVLYDDNWGMPAARVLWALKRYGHSKVAVLTGGWERWQEEGRRQETEPVEPVAARFKPEPDDDQVADLDWLQAHLDDPGTVLIDTRTVNEYVQGHLDGAILWDWMNAVPLAGWDTFRPLEELRSELERVGATPDKELVTYCRSGARAAHTYLLLQTLGYPRVRLYDGSWLEWSQKEFHSKGGSIH